MNNAGVKGFDPLDSLTEEIIDGYFAVNAKAPYLLTKRALDLMPNGGRIINISSSSTQMSSPAALAYSMSKGALEQITQHLAPVLASRDITINTVSPGMTETDHPFFRDPQFREFAAGLSIFNRIGSVSEVADIVAFVASDEARWMTGVNLDATGGSLLTLAMPQANKAVNHALLEESSSSPSQAVPRAEDADILEAAGIAVVDHAVT
ncbi:SDR family oxidoreductase (plasmid) [Streptomyces chartreusis]|uniref:SDR family NAD(P)-dependent oxidoreductase n=1 Tax=Streptomyces chartreusis TaxID=1969 RepID=UPI003865A9A1|nr:SDR family oxidoreductase [Streptomyces chartreusis]